MTSDEYYEMMSEVGSFWGEKKSLRNYNIFVLYYPFAHALCQYMCKCVHIILMSVFEYIKNKISKCHKHYKVLQWGISILRISLNADVV